jgi:hypothetical protein
VITEGLWDYTLIIESSPQGGCRVQAGPGTQVWRASGRALPLPGDPGTDLPVRRRATRRGHTGDDPAFQGPPGVAGESKTVR